MLYYAMEFLEEKSLVDDREVILNKKAVYEPTKGQRFRQIVCSRAWAVGVLFFMGTVIVAVAVIAAFARPGSISQCHFQTQESASSSMTPGGNLSVHIEPETYISTNGEPFPWKDLRLPGTLVPEFYNIFFHANISESYFIGNIQMTLRVSQQTDFIVFHSKELSISNVTAYAGQAIGTNKTFDKKVDILKVLEYPRNEQVYLKLSSYLQVNSYVQVQVDFRGSLASLTSLVGFYKSSYTVNGQKRYMASTQFEPTSARLAFPCLDEPSLKAKFVMSMVRDKDHITLFNSPLKQTVPLAGGLLVDKYEETVKMSTYLVAFIVCDFKNISAVTQNGTQVSVFAPEDKIYMAKLALTTAVTLLDFYSQYFGTPYPLKKQDLIGIPNFGAGAMENWGLITFRESDLLFDPNLSTSASKRSVIATVAHELAHQWFGNLVTMKWWNDLWLNEGFASYVENQIGTDRIDPTVRMKDNTMLKFYEAMSLDSLSASHPIAVAVHDPSEIESLFDSVSYKKGSAVIRMLENFLTEKVFREGLRSYLQKHKYGNAETKDLWDALQEVSSLPHGLSVSDIMDTWTKQMGYPVVTVTRDGEMLHLTQQRFLIDEQPHDDGARNENLSSPFGYKWIIPFTYTTSQPDQKEPSLMWLSDKQGQLRLKDGSVKWIKANVDTQGYYRVNYDEKSWRDIIQQLKENHTVFTVADRIGLIEDVFALARAGLTDYKIALDLTAYLVNEEDYFVWAAAIAHLSFIIQRVFLEEEYDLMRNYTLSLSKSHIDRVGRNSQSDPVAEYMQSLMMSMACSLDYQKVINEVTETFKQWKSDRTITLSNGLRGTVYSQGVKSGNKADWNLVFERYQKEGVPSEKHTLLRALAASRNARDLQILLAYEMDDSKIKAQDSSSIIPLVSSTENGRLFAWRYFQMHYNELFKRFGRGAFLFSSIVTDVVSSFNTQFDYDEVVRFFNNKDLGPAKKALEQALEYVRSHITWTKKYLPIVKAWIQEVARA